MATRPTARPTSTPAPRPGPAGTPPDDTPADAVACRVVGLTRTYGTGSTAVRALDEVSVDFPRGTFTAVMGPSGSGKSTLLHCLAGLDTPDAGQVLLGGTDLTRLSDRQLTELRRDRIGFVFQSFNLLPTLTAEQNILLPLDLAGRRRDAAEFDAIVGALGLGDRLGHRPSELSGGQQQRVAVARALIGRPELIVADEPTGALDTRTGQTLLAFLRTAVRESGRTVVMVTHDPVAASFADRVVLLTDGRVAGTLDHPDADTVLEALQLSRSQSSFVRHSPDSSSRPLAPVAPVAR